MQVSIEIKDDQLENVLSSAHIGYWGYFSQSTTLERIKNLINGDNHVTIVETEDTSADEFKKHKLTLNKLRSSVMILAAKYPHRLKELLDDTESDMYTGDLLIQCAIFGEEKYS